jgi:cysteine synthase
MVTERLEMRVARHVFELIGQTPLVKINKINPNPAAEIYAKLEWFNPMGSLKDRIALTMIEAAEKEKRLTKGKIILEATSGNTGISIAWVAALKGYKCVIVMPKGVSEERKKILDLLGADLILTNTETEAIAKAREMAKDPHYAMTDQFANDTNWKTHYQTTAQEVWEQTSGKLTHFVAGIGTSGTIMGVGRKLKELNPKIQIVGVQPSRTPSKQQGLLNLKEFRPEICKVSEVVDEMIMVDDENAFRTARDLIVKEGLFAGISSGSAMYGAIQKAREIQEGLIVTVLGDHGFKYLSTDLFARQAEHEMQGSV